MTEENRTPSSEEKDGLDLQDVKDLTVGEAVRKDSEIKAGVTDEDGVLDKYIKQHRDEVTSQKFESKISDFEELDTATLDDFIKKQREELATNGFGSIDYEMTYDEDTEDAVAVSDESEATAKGSQDESPTQEQEDNANHDNDATIIAGVAPLVEGEQTEKVTEEETTLALGDTTDAQPFYKKRGVLIGALLAILLGILAIAYGLNYFGKGETETTSSSSVTTNSTSSSSDDAKEDKESFDTLYATFFTDTEQTKLKNSAFDSISELEESLAKLEGTSYYDEAKEQYDALVKQIEAIQAVSALFESEVIRDGEKLSATVKSDADFDALSSDVLNTGNATLDTLIQAVIADGRSQLSEKSSATTQSTTTTESTTTTTTDTTSTNAGVSGYGITTYDVTTLQRSLSRVPYSESAIADSSNSAWTFADGVLEKIVATSQARGYFSGNDYILEKVAIINGNGYYNMFKSDGTYLFSINAKTGYFVGNASGNADALDY